MPVWSPAAACPETAVSRPHLARAVVALLALTGAVVGCGGSDEGQSADGDPTTTTVDDPATSEAQGADPKSSAPAAEDPYDGHTSEAYDEGASWICRPDLDDACRDLDVTTIDADGTRTVEEREPADDPPIDCFYVYPTVSTDPGTNSDLEVAPGDNEVLTVVAQAAQLARSCRVFAPVYRQVTLGGLGSGGFAEGGAIAYGDVVDAWKTYVSQWNEGRGVIVVGHSQGAGHLRQLVADEIDDVAEVRDRLVAAYLFGGTVEVPEGETVGGSFDEVPACTEAEQVGCVVTWSSYPDTAPPGDNAIFGRAGEPDQRALCVDAVALLGRDHANPVAPINAPLVGGIEGTEGIETPFVALPGAVDVACDATDTHDYLSVSLADPADERPLDGLVEQRLGPAWGLHLVDMTVALDDLVELAARQGEAFAEG